VQRSAVQLKQRVATVLWPHQAAAQMRTRILTSAA